MLRLALGFLVVAILAGLFGFTKIVDISTDIAWILFLVGIVMAVIFFILGRRPSTA